MKKIFYIIIVFFFSQKICAQDCMQIGTNLGGIDSQVFKDLKKTSSHFYTQNSYYIADDPNDWDTQLIDSIPTDINGYPTIDIPFNHSTVDTTQMYHFLVGIDSIYPTGHYIMDFEGTGVLNISNWSIAENITFPSANRIEFDIIATSSTGIHIEVSESDASDYIRNITIVHEDDLSSFQTLPFREELIELSKDFECLRFMDWMGTNMVYYSGYESTPLIWSDRIPKQKHRVYDEEGGMSYEHIIEFSNEVDKSVWINIPHLADSNYILQMSQMFRDNLNPDLTIYLEFSNEVWNTIFQQTDYVQFEGPYLNDGPRNYGWYSAKAFNIFKDVFGETGRGRLKFVLAGLDGVVLDALPVAEGLGINIDAVSYPGYFNLGDAGWQNLDDLGSLATANDVITQAQNNLEEDFYWMKRFKELICDPNDIEFVMYEGGQHLLRSFGVEESFQQAIYEAQLSPEMNDLYNELLSFCRDSLDVKLFNHYLLYGPNESNYGSWGMVESIYETPDTEKYNALMSFKCEDDEEIDIPTDTTSILKMTNEDFSLFPNPATNLITIKLNDNFNGLIYVYSSTGRLIINESIEGKQITFNVSDIAPGVYYVKGESYKKQFNHTFNKK